MTTTKMKPKRITSRNYADQPMTLLDETTFAPIHEGDVRTLRDGELHKVTGGRAPHKENSSGKVWTTALSNDGWTGEYYPNVIGAKWMHDSTLAARAPTFPHAEAPEMITAVNKARQKARRAARRR